MSLIKAKITVGDKWTISLDESPLNGGGTVSPLGSVAYVREGALASIWQKTGAGDLDWTMVQAGSPTDGWNISYTIAGLDNATADAYFGTNAVAFDGKIIFARKGNVMMEFTNLNIIESTRALRMRDALGTTYIEVKNDLMTLKTSGQSDVIMQNSAGTFYVGAGLNDIQNQGRRLVRNAEGSLQNGGYIDTQEGVRWQKQGKKFSGQTLTNADLNITMIRPVSFGASAFSKGTLTLVINGFVDGLPANAVFKIDFQTVGSTVIFNQDALVNQDNQALEAKLTASIVFNANDQFGVKIKTLKNAKQMTNTTIAIFIEEHLVA